MADEGRLKMLQENTRNIRNLCILAHVDHGKTTLADSLIASNGIISHRLAGKLRYLDNLSQEKTRGITMKSSAISLHHRYGGEDYLLNLIDSPGHVDFSGEVSTAVRLCDGAFIVVDVVEGVCPQTVTVLQQAWAECIKPCLVLNKCDRLITEMKFSPDEAYVHLQRVLEQVNSKMGELHSSTVMEKEHMEYSKEKEPPDYEPESQYNWSSGLDLDENDDENLYFTPERGNVVFASAADGWAFRISTFAEQYQKKMGIRKGVLQKTLWGDYYLNNKAKQISKGAYAKGKRPLFVTFILDSIWNVYKAVLLQRNSVKIDQIVTSLKLRIAPRDARSTDYRVHLFAVCSAWLPLAAAVLDMTCEMLPSPLELSTDKITSLLCSGVINIDQLPPQSQDLSAGFRSCSSDGPLIVYVSKMFSVLPGAISTNKHRPLTDDEIERRRDAAKIRNQQKLTVNFNPDTIELGPKEESEDLGEKEEEKEHFVAFCRIYSGRIEPGKQVFVLGPRHDPRTIATQERTTHGVNVHVGKVALGPVYLLMGGDLEVVPSIAAGNICGIGGLQDLIQKSATISDTLYCPPFHGMSHWQTPVLRVAIEPKNPAEIPQLIMGMKLLNQADPCVETSVLDTGELVLCTSGEVHLERCIEDLKTRFSKIDIKVSPPLVSFRETIIPQPKLDKLNEAIISEDLADLSLEKAHTSLTSNKAFSFTIQAYPLSESFVNFIAENTSALKCLVNSTLFAGSTNHTPVPIDEHSDFKIEEFKLLLEEFLEGIQVVNCIEKIICFGPNQIGPNILINNISRYDRPVIWPGSDSENLDLSSLWDYESSVIRGFDLATSSGPLCEEPMAATAYVIHEWSEFAVKVSSSDSIGAPIAGQIVSAVKEGCRQAFLKQPCRLMIAMYKCEIQASAEVLGRVYAVLAKRQGRVLSEELREGSGTFVIAAVLPVAESLGFAEEIRKKTSGFAMPQLVFSHWETLQEDPFWVPTTEEELTHFGELGDSGNVAHDYMMSARKRKGLPTDEQIVVSGEKQRTLKKNK